MCIRDRSLLSAEHIDRLIGEENFVIEGETLGERPSRIGSGGGEVRPRLFHRVESHVGDPGFDDRSGHEPLGWRHDGSRVLVRVEIGVNIAGRVSSSEFGWGFA